MLKITIVIIIFTAISCNNINRKLTSESDNRNQQMVQCKNFTMIAEEIITKDTLQQDVDHINIQTKIMLSKEQFDNNKNLSLSLQYGLDSAFILENNQDTIWPSYVMPVANGQSLNPQFIIEFPVSKEAVGNSFLFKAVLKNLSTKSDSGIVFHFLTQNN